MNVEGGLRRATPETRGLISPKTPMLISLLQPLRIRLRCLCSIQNRFPHCAHHAHHRHGGRSIRRATPPSQSSIASATADRTCHDSSGHSNRHATPPVALPVQPHQSYQSSIASAMADRVHVCTSGRYIRHATLRSGSTSKCTTSHRSAPRWSIRDTPIAKHAARPKRGCC